jgi:uncharacterized membrane protein
LKKIPIISIILLIFSVLVLAISWNKLPPQVPFYYSLPWGEDQLTNPLDLWLIPGSIFIVILVNFLFHKLFREEALLKQIAEAVTTIFAFLALFTLVRIILIAI